MAKNTLSQIKNPLAVPRIVKVVVSSGIGQIKTNPKFEEIVAEGLALITGQKPAERRARKAISGFKIRQGDKVGMVVTLRGKRMEDFTRKLANIVLPRVRDFRGLNPQGFDKNGNYTIAITEQLFFPEITSEKSEVIFGMAITIVTTAKDNQEGQKLLEAWGFPFKKKEL